MKILVLNWLDRENPQAGGAELHLHETFGRLVGRGHHVDLVCSGWPGAPADARLDGLCVHRCGGRHTHALVATPVARRLLAAGRHDVVVEDLNKIPLFAPAWARAPVVALYHHLFGATAFKEASLPLALATWLLERPIPRVYRGLPSVAVSKSTREDLDARGLDAPIRVIPNGLDHRRYSPDPAGALTPEPTLLVLGRLKRYKRIELTIDAVARLRSEGLDARLEVAGSGDHEEALRAHAERIGVGNAVRFLGFVSEAEKVRLLRSSWVHVFTSPKEGWGLTNLEAAACGTPSVASDSPGLRESVQHGRTGLLVPHGDADALAGALRRLVQDPELREELGREAIRFAGRFTWERTATDLEDVLQEAATHRR